MHPDRVAKWRTTDFWTLKRWRLSLKSRMKVNKKTGCWEWQLSTNPKGYGNVTFGNTGGLAHRLAWELYHGPVPDGLCVLHKCDNPGCVNPVHLWTGTYAENNADRDAKGRWKKGAGPGLGEGHHSSKLKENEARKILALARMGHLSQREIGRRFRISHSVVSEILNGKAWPTIQGEK